MLHGNEAGKSEFNDSLGYLSRLNTWWWGAGQASIMLDAFSWFNFLCLIYRELSTEVSDDRKPEFDRRIKELNTMVMAQVGINQARGVKEINNKLYMELQRLDIDLRSVQDKAGLLVKRADDPRSALR